MLLQNKDKMPGPLSHFLIELKYLYHESQVESPFQKLEKHGLFLAVVFDCTLIRNTMQASFKNWNNQPSLLVQRHGTKSPCNTDREGWSSQSRGDPPMIALQIFLKKPVTLALFLWAWKIWFTQKDQCWRFCILSGRYYESQCYNF